MQLLGTSLPAGIGVGSALMHILDPRRAAHHQAGHAHSPAARLVVGLVGAGVLAYGITRRAPWSWFVGSVGTGLMLAAMRQKGLHGMMPSQLEDWMPSHESPTSAGPHAAPQPWERAEVGAPYAAGF